MALLRLNIILVNTLIKGNIFSQGITPFIRSEVKCWLLFQSVVPGFRSGVGDGVKRPYLPLTRILRDHMCLLFVFVVAGFWQRGGVGDERCRAGGGCCSHRHRHCGGQRVRTLVPLLGPRLRHSLPSATLCGSSSHLDQHLRLPGGLPGGLVLQADRRGGAGELAGTHWVPILRWDIQLPVLPLQDYDDVNKPRYYPAFQPDRQTAVRGQRAASVSGRVLVL